MYQITDKKVLATGVVEMTIRAPRVAKAHKPGQFLMVMNREESERIPLTIADSNPETGEVTIVFLEVGRSTIELGQEFREGDELFAVLGPLGTPTHIENYGTVVVIGGGLGVAPIYPICKGLKAAGNKVVTIIGYRRKDLMFWNDKLAGVSDEVIITTDDGSCGIKGFVTTALEQLHDEGRTIDRIVAIGPPIMMRVVAEKTQPWGIPTIVSLNTIMVDGTGMCGGCRIAVGDETKFVCVDGPDFDGHKVDWDQMFNRMKVYKKQEQKAIAADPSCNLYFETLKR
jgi:ferredoxin--NADP+ reductase